MQPNINYVNHIQTIENIFSQLKPNSGPYNINMKNDKSLLMSQINRSVMIGEHPHPLFECYTPGRIKAHIWFCKNCKCKYSYSVPSFYCTACDYDMCQRCMSMHPAYKIKYILIRMKNLY